MHRAVVRIGLAVALGVSTTLAMGPELIGKPAPGFTLTSVDGRSTLSLAELRGHVVIIDFWASWCAPCSRSLPQLAAFEAKLSGVRILAVNIDDVRENAVEFLKQHRVKLTSLYDDTKRVAGRYNVPAMPSAVVVDRYGVVRFVHAGYTGLLKEDAYEQVH
ncbi:MAG: TlpA disulfide reductase family protein [Bacteroidota bacterium]